jgi:hypothetical protein
MKRLTDQEIEDFNEGIWKLLPAMKRVTEATKVSNKNLMEKIVTGKIPESQKAEALITLEALTEKNCMIQNLILNWTKVLTEGLPYERLGDEKFVEYIRLNLKIMKTVDVDSLK